MMWRGKIKELPIHLSSSNKFNWHLSVSITLFKIRCNPSQIIPLEKKLLFISFVTVNSCTDTPCQNGGTCTVTGDNSYVCECLDGFQGNNCDTSKISKFKIALVPYFTPELLFSLSKSR